MFLHIEMYRFTYIKIETLETQILEIYSDFYIPMVNSIFKLVFLFFSGQHTLDTALLTTQIRNIRKTLLPTQMPLTIFKTYESISAGPPTCHPRSFVPPPPLSTSQPLSQVRRVELVILVTPLTQGAS